jgi:hypothetical protein
MAFKADFCVSRVSDQVHAFYAVTWRPDDEPPELCRLGRPGVGIGQRTDNAMANLLIIF